MENTAPHIKAKELSERRATFFSMLEVLKSKRQYIFYICMLAVTGTFAGHFLQVPAYETKASVFVQALADPTAADYLLHQQMGRSNKADRIETYIRYLSSDQFFLSAAQRLKFHPNIHQIDFSNPRSKSAFKFAFWKKNITSFFGFVDDSSKSSHKSTEDLAGFIKGACSFETDYSHFIHVKTKTLDPDSAKIIADIVTEEFVAITNQRGLSEINQIREFVLEKIDTTQEKLRTVEIELIDFKKNNNIISTQASSTALSDRYTDLSKKLETAQITFEENKRLIDFFQTGQQKKLEAMTSTESSTSSTKQTAYVLQKKLEQLKRQKSLIIAQEDKNETYRLQIVNKEIAKTANSLKKYVSQLRTGTIFSYMNPKKIQFKIQALKEENEILSRSMGSYRRAIAKLGVKIKHIPSLAQKQLMLESRLKLETDNYSMLQNKLSELEIQKISHKKEVRIDQTAAIAGRSPKGPLLLKGLFALFISIFVSVSIILGLETLDPTVKQRSDLTDCGLEFVGDIPLINKDVNALAAKYSFGTSDDLICFQNPESLESMAFKYLRARIESSRYKLKKKNQIIAISAPTVNVGKSFISANLAASLGQLQRKVLIMDCDLRKPSQSNYFQVEDHSLGLVDLLDMKASLNECIHNEVIPSVDYLPAGICSEQSTEYIASEKFKALIKHLSSVYDYIVIDTPPAFAAVDASIIIGYSDIPILVSSFRETKKSDLLDAYHQLLEVSYKKVYGIINKAVISSSRLHYYGYHTQVLNSDSPRPLSSHSENHSDLEAFLDNLK